MGFFSNVLSNKKHSMIDVYRNATDEILNELAIHKTDAKKLKTSVYLLMAMIACLEAIAKGKSRPFFDEMIEAVEELVKDYKMRVSELAIDSDELLKILSFFDSKHGVDGDTTINGYAAFKAIYEKFLTDVVLEIYNNRGDEKEGKVFLIASIVLVDALLTSQHDEKYIPVSLIITKMMGDVIKAFK